MNDTDKQALCRDLERLGARRSALRAELDVVQEQIIGRLRAAREARMSNTGLATCLGSSEAAVRMAVKRDRSR